MKISLKACAFGSAFALLLPLAAQAHKPWMEPSKTVLSVGQWVTVDVAAATVPFIKDHVGIPLDNLVITAPDGSTVPPENAAKGKLRSSFDLQLNQAGTYRIANNNTNISASWTEDGKPKRWPPRFVQYTPEAFAKEVPAKAKDLKVTQVISRLETYVTAGKPSEGALKLSGKGLELAPASPVNDLYAGEEATLLFVIDGKPAADVEFELIADGSRYRDAIGETMLKTDKNGALKITWPTAGLYYLSAAVTDDKGEKPAKQRRSSYAGIFEVLAP